MRTRKIVDREQELEQLRRLAKSPPTLIVMRGRRRVGKSFLLGAAFPGNRVVSFQADQQPRGVQLELLAREAARLLPARAPLSFADWETALSFFEEQATVAPLVLVLDEFQYLCESQPDLPSVVQRVWDRWDHERIPVTLVLCGSALTFMEGLLGGGAPLFGRSAYRPLVLPLDHRQAAGFAPRLGAEALIERYAVLGGTPQYHVWAGSDPLAAVTRRAILSKGGPLYEEPDHLIRREEGVRDPRRYLSTLEAIAAGRTRTGEVASRIESDPGNTSRLLERLAALGYVELREPLERKAARARAYWRIKDPFFRFWFSSVRPNRSRLERERVDEVAREIEISLDGHAAAVFEDCCRDWVARYSEIGASADRIGSWWSRRGDVEIDVVGMRGADYVLLGSCKWSRQLMTESVLDHLYTARAALGARAAHARLAAFARRGFEAKLRKRAGAEGVLLITAKDLYGKGAGAQPS